MGRLYGAPESYARLFSLDEQELSFWRAVLPLAAGGQSGTRWLLDLGAGPMGLGAALLAGGGQRAAPGGAPWKCFEIDASETMLRGAGSAGSAAVAHVRCLPIARGAVAAAVCRLFALNYAAGTGAPLQALAVELARVLAPGARVALEVCVAPDGRAVQGLREEAVLEGGTARYAFQYGVLEPSAAGFEGWGWVLETEIEYSVGVGAGATAVAEREREGTLTLAAPLFIFSPGGLRRFSAALGLTGARVHASYSAREARAMEDSLPPDCLRGVLVGEVAR